MRIKGFTRMAVAVMAFGLMALHAAAQDRYVIRLKDKDPGATSFSLSNPSAFLSARAQLRRAGQGIALDSTDLPVSPNYVAQVAATGASVLGASRWLNTVTVQANPAQLAAVNALPFVISTANVGRSTGGHRVSDKFATESVTAAETMAAHQKAAAFNYGPGLNQIAMVGGDVMHSNGYTGKGYLIAVIDAGFYRADSMTVFDSLFTRGQVLATYDFVSNDTNVFDDGTHGSYVLSLMAANWPGNLVGTAPDADYLLLRSEYGPAELIIEEYDWAEAAEYADSAGADVINSSLGYTEFDDSTQNHTYLDMDGNTAPVTQAADFAAKKGIVVCNSAGNSGTGSWFFIGAPADADSILTVGGVDSAGIYIPFSSKGPTADGRIKPDVAAQAFQTYVAELFNAGAVPGNGTSFSSPIMAGMAACLWQCHPTATNMQIIEALRMSGSQASNPDSLLGYGIPYVPQACVILSEETLQGPPAAAGLVPAGPNPFHEALTFGYRADRAEAVTFSLADLSGRVLWRERRNVGPGLSTFRFPAPVAEGVYLLSAQAAGLRSILKVIKD